MRFLRKETRCQRVSKVGRAIYRADTRWAMVWLSTRSRFEHHLPTSPRQGMPQHN